MWYSYMYQQKSRNKNGKVKKNFHNNVFNFFNPKVFNIFFLKDPADFL